MRWLSREKVSPIGLDLGSHSFKAVQLKWRRGGWAVGVSVSLPRATPEVPLAAAEIQRLENVLERRGFVGRDVVIAVPNAGLLTAVLELPARGAGVPLAQIAEVEFARLHKVDAASVTLSVWDLPPSVRASKATYMLAVGAKSGLLEAHADVVESGRLNVVAIDEPYSAGARGCVHAGQSGPGLTAVIDLGWDAATLAILNANTVVYTRRLPDAGLKGVYREAADGGITDTDEIDHDLWHVGFAPRDVATAGDTEVMNIVGARMATMLKEIGQAVSYTGHQYPDVAVEKALLIGGGALVAGMAGRCQEVLGVPTHAVAFGDPFGGTLAANMLPAVGLAAGHEEVR